MANTDPGSTPESLLLGEIETQIIGVRPGKGGILPGDRMHVLRDRGNQHDHHALRLQNPQRQTIGYLPQEIAGWLAPLVDAAKITLAACVPWSATTLKEKYSDPQVLPLLVSVFLCDPAEDLLEKKVIRDGLDALHQVVHRAWCEAQQFRDERLVAELAERLQPLKRQELLPETRLLLELLPGLAREIHAVQGLQAVTQLQQLLKLLKVSEPLHYSGIVIFPLAWPEATEPPYRLLSEAIGAGTAVVEEVSEGGSVSELRLRNRDDRPILLIEGEILIGAKQNRLVNLTLLAPAQTTTIIPVSCVEQGRWRSVSPQMQPCYHAPPELRAKNRKSVQANRGQAGPAHGDQRQVWAEVDHGLAALGVRSPTASLTDGLEALGHQGDRQQLPQSLPKAASGVFAVFDKNVFGMDLFDCPATLAALWPRLAQAYLFDALRMKSELTQVGPEVVHTFAECLVARATPRVPAIGLGSELEMSGEGLVGSALLYDSRLCHLSAFFTER